jgi:hypothetical protein
MHIGRAGNPSKTKFIFFPPPHFFNLLLPTLLTNCINNNDENTALTYSDDILTETNCSNEQYAKKQKEHEEMLYNALEETKPIEINDGYVTFCCHFKYIGSYVSLGLCDTRTLRSKSPQHLK